MRSQKITYIHTTCFDIEDDEPEESESIYEAIRDGEIAVVEQLLAQDPELVNHRSQDTECPVSHYVALHGDEDLQRLVLTSPMTDVNAMWNAPHGPRSILAYTRLPVEALELVLAREDFLQINFQDTAGRSALHYAVISNDCDRAQRLINDPRIDLTLQSSSGKTALDVAEEHGLDDLTGLIRNKLEAIHNA